MNLIENKTDEIAGYLLRLAALKKYILLLVFLNKRFKLYLVLHNKRFPAQVNIAELEK